jgi:hypothetical protein
MTGNEQSGTSGKQLRTSLSADAWAPVGDALLHGLVHTANNRIAALGGILQLQELELATQDEGIQSVREEFAKLRTLMERFRDISSKRGAAKVAAVMADALNGAALLMAQHATARQWKLNITEAGSDVEPVLLWPSDPLRFACMLLLAAGGPGQGAEVLVATLQNGPMVEVTVVSPVSAAEVMARPEFIGLQAAAALEGGSLSAVAINENASVAVTLALPGLSLAGRGA